MEKDGFGHNIFDILTLDGTYLPILNRLLQIINDWKLIDPKNEYEKERRSITFLIGEYKDNSFKISLREYQKKDRLCDLFVKTLA